MTHTAEEHDRHLPDLLKFIQAGGITLRRYQESVARAVVDSVIHRGGLSFVVMFPRQSGKNELQAQIEVYLLSILREQDAEIVKISPTWRPQSLNAMRRLERVLNSHPATQKDWVKESGLIYRVGRARITFLSGSPEAHIVGATASTLLEVDEAQDVTIPKFDRDILPMAASTNATRVFWGTAWNTQTLLARELRTARDAERAGAVQLAFVLTADVVAAEVPVYGAFVAAQVARLGREHILVRTQYYSEEIDGQVGMFPADRLALMNGDHPLQVSPSPGKTYALLLDIAGADESGGQTLPSAGQLDQPLSERRDSTALTIVEVDLSTCADPLINAPTYRVMARQVWTNKTHADLYPDICELARHWRAARIVVDATGVGAGLASLLVKAFGEKVIAFIFTSASKSKLGYDFLAVVTSGRWKEPRPSGPGDPAQTGLFFHQLRHCQYEVRPGPGRIMRWGVPDGARDIDTRAFIHDDLIFSAALCAVLDGLDWPSPSAGTLLIARAPDPLKEMRGF